MNDTANQDCRILLDVLIAQGLRDAVLSPGSRNAPLLIAASARHELHSHVVTDERTAGFLALGMAVASQRPVMLACTSGTALYNYAPAVAEAMYQKTPLIVVTADRPARWIDQDDSQTLRQPDALEKIVKRSFNITTAEGEGVATKGPRFGSEREWFVNRTVNEAWLAATQGTPGPVHINIQLDNPLAETIADAPRETPRIISVVEGNSGLRPDTVMEWARHMAGKKVLVTAGFMRPDNALSRALNEFMRLPNVAVCAEPISNLHIPADAWIIDALLHPRTANPQLTAEIRRSLRPDIVISIGGALVSRMLKDFLREYQPDELYTLADTDWGTDCFQSLTTHFDVKPAQFFRSVTAMTRRLERKGRISGPVPEYAAMWRDARREHTVPARSFAENTWSEMAAFSMIFDHLPADYNLFLSNGTPVRYAALCMERMPHACYGNRGVSGIEGTSATAAGIAIKYSGPTLLITGDMSFGYTPQIMGLDLLPDNFKIIIVSNAGGGIFRFIRTTRALQQREEFFCADRPQPVEALAHAYGWEYMTADSRDSLQSRLDDFFSSPSRTILELRVDPEQSAAVLINYLEK